MIERDLAQNPIIASRSRSTTAIGANAVSAQGPHDQLVNGRQLAHEIPWVFAVAAARHNDGVQLVVRFGAQQLKTHGPRVV